MTTTFRSVRAAITLAGASLMLAYCAPTNAHAIRQDKSLTLGLPGVSYRPTGKIAVGSTFDLAHEEDLDLNTTPKDSKGKRDELPENDREITKRTVGVRPFVQYFPWETSAFFVGAGAQLYSNKYRYNEFQTGASLTNPSYAEVEYATKANYMTVPFGFAWIWPNGFSFTADIGPRVYVGGSGTLTNDGTNEGVDEAQRDQTIKRIMEDEKQVYLFSAFPTAVIGYSF